MATNKGTIVPEKSDRVRVKIPRIAGEKNQPDFILAVNGETIQIQRGIEVEIPIKFAKALELHERECDEAEAIGFNLVYEG